MNEKTAKDLKSLCLKLWPKVGPFRFRKKRDQIVMLKKPEQKGKCCGVASSIVTNFH